MRSALAVLLAASLSLPAMAGETDWLEVAPDVMMRVISSGEVGADGRALVGLEIDMPATAKTYWRVPGETGIPTTLDLAGSRGIAGHEIRWPYPVVSETGGYLDFAYFGRTVLPVELVLDGPTAELELSALLGICFEICVPVQASFALELGAEPADPANRLRLMQALAETPLDWDAAGAPIGHVWYDEAHDALAVEITGSGVDPASLVGAFEGEGPLLGAPEPAATDDHVLLPLIGRGAEAGLDGRAVDLVFRTPSGPYRLTRAVGAH